MNRKDFLQTSIPLLATAAAFNRTQNLHPKSRPFPPYLKKGSTIGITCPSGYITRDEVQPCIKELEAWGFKVILGETIGMRDGTFGGSDEERAKDFQRMIDEDYIDAVLLGRGGYGAVRIIDKIDFSRFREKPKWIIGFSDATVFHLHLNSRLDVPSIHSKMCNSFPADKSKMTVEQADSIDSIRRVLLGEEMIYKAPTLLANRAGTASGKLVGGNLSIIQMLNASNSAIDTENCILYLEDVGEYLYKLDGMMWNLKRSGKLDKLKALIVGAFRIKPDDPGEEFGLSLYEIIREKVQDYSYPVCFDFPVGHVAVNYAIKSGSLHRLEVGSDYATLTSLE